MVMFDVLYRSFSIKIWVFPLKKNPFSLRGVLATQSHFLRTCICDQLYTRSIPDRTNRQKLYPYPDPHFSSTVVGLSENEGMLSMRYNDQIFRTGAAYPFSDDIQIEGSIGVNTNTRPSANFNLAYHID